MTASAPTQPPDGGEEKTAPSGKRPRGLDRLFQPVDIASLVAFRICFGALMVWEIYRFYVSGYIKSVWVEPVFHFTYHGFSWVQPWPGDGIYWHCLLVTIAAAGIALGLFYRASCALFTLGWFFLFLVEQSRYVNHFYLIGLIGFLLTIVPAHRAFSLDALRIRKLRAHTVPAWCPWLLRAQMGIVYTYSGIAKLDSDWLQGEPLRDFLVTKAHWPLIGNLFYEEWVVYLSSYGALFVTLFAVPLLLWKRSRPWMFTLLLFFHISNAVLFNIGVFPALAITATTIFFEPDWPRRLFRRLAPARKPVDHPTPATAAVPSPSRHRRAVLAFLTAYLGIQVLVPLRHFLYPGYLQWTEEGQMFSWHLKSRSKDSTARFLIKSAGKEEVWEINPADYLTPWQHHKMKSRPGLVLQFSHHLARELEAQGYRDVEVRALVRTSLNRRPHQFLIDPSVDLAAQPRTWRHDEWIKPLKASIPERHYLEKPKKKEPK